MSQEAKSALINTPNRQGATVRADGLTLSELAVKGLIGSDNGLTRKGSIVREQTVAEALDRAFG